jgi:hypothetical protein
MGAIIALAMRGFKSGRWVYKDEKRRKLTWQCASQTPGLSFWKAMARNPEAGSIATSRRGGLERFSWEGSV